MFEHLRTKYRYTNISQGNRERENSATTCAVISDRWLGKSLSDTCVLTTGTRKYVKASKNEETCKPPVQSNRAGGWRNHCRTTNYDLGISIQKYLKATGTRKLFNHLCSQIGQVAWEIIIGEL
ncbi:hypothetical protein GBA52_014939 [Prunus armeniaca]|nr:hypothetical protein GBA52_014939 [Prunus armeniaca]